MIILTYKRVKFYSLKDEDAFFEWIKKIECIESFSGKGDELYLHITSKNIDDGALRDLLALFYRYKIRDMKQFAIFLNDCNRAWFFEGHKGYWHKCVFGSDQKD